MNKRTKFELFLILVFFFDFIADGIPIGSLVLLIAAFYRPLASFIGHKLLEHANNVQ